MTSVAIESLETIQEEWEALASRLGATPFHTPGWTAAWWAAFGRGKLWVLAARRGGELVGVLPMVERKKRLLSPTNWHTAEHGALAESLDVENELYRKLVSTGLRRIDLAFLTEEDSSALTRVLASAGYRTDVRVIQQSPYLQVDGEWQAYWTSRSKNLRGTVRRCRNRLADLGEVTIEVNSGEENLEQQLSEGFAIEGSGWKEARGTAIASRPETLQFYRDLARYAARQGTLCLAFLRIDGRAAAFNFSLESGGHHYLIKLGHDPELNQAGPGTVLTAAMLERAFELGMRTYEFLGAADSYKLRWTSSCHDRLRVQAFAPTLSGQVDRLVQVRGRSLARKLLRRRPTSS